MPERPLKSITATETFRARAQRSEATRVALWLGLLIAMLVLLVLRRLTGGEVMSSNAVFVPTMSVFAIAILIQIGLLTVLRKAVRRGVLLPIWLVPATAIADFVIVVTMLLILQWRSPRGSLAELSAPAVLLFPLLILTSVLRLRPIGTLILGLGAACFHWTISVNALTAEGAGPELYPVYLTYGVALLIIGVAGVLVARTMRAHVQEAIDEAVAREASDHRNAVVQRDLTVARDIQRGLLPSTTPDFPGYDIAGFNRSADLTGGDYYDWQLLPDGRLIAVLADVAGHGIGPAMVMAVCRAYARASVGMIEDPSHLMVRINRLLQGDLPSDRFITFVLAMLQPSGALKLVSAGHGPTLIYRAATGEVDRFNGDGLPLGIDENDPYLPAIELQLLPGDVLMMLTDGFFEWHRLHDREQFGTDRLVETLKANAGESAERIIQKMDQAVIEFACGETQKDDVTAVVIKRLANP